MYDGDIGVKIASCLSALYATMYVFGRMFVVDM